MSLQTSHQGFPEMTDRGSFLQFVENIAKRRSGNEKRRFPRFPTSEALSGEIGARGFSGALICDADTVSELETVLNAASGEFQGETRGEDDESVRGVNVVDFSEDGLQLQLYCRDWIKLSKGRLQLRMDGALAPVSFRWCKQSGKASRGGFAFQGDIEENPGLIKVLNILSDKLVDFLYGKMRMERKANWEQEAVFLYICLFYNLRLKLLLSLSSLNEVKRLLIRNIGLSYSSKLEALFSERIYSKDFQLDLARKHAGSSYYRRLQSVFMKPYSTFGCCLIGGGEDAVLIGDDAVNAIANSLVVAKLPPGEDQRDMSPLVKELYEKFTMLRSALPEYFMDDEFVKQFFIYNSLLRANDKLNAQLLDLLSGFAENREH